MNNIYSVGQVNSYVRNMFTQDYFLQKLQVKGEVSNCKYHTSGHIYFSLKDETGTLSCVMFAGQRKGLAFRMKDGDQVVVAGTIDVYQRDGRYQMYAREITLEGAGDLYRRFLLLKQELEEMGMFAQEYKQEIPRFVKRLGVVTAPTGAAVQDIRNISLRRNPYLQIVLYPALVQGEGAPESIMKGIRILDGLDLDVIIVGRGGGSIEDLWAFNEEMVARAIFDCRIPVISAVGHQTDFTIADYVADLRAPTPSAAAELAVFDYRQAMQELLGMRQQMDKELQRKVTVARNHLEHQRMRLHYLSPQQRMNENRRRVAEYEEKLTGRMEELLRERRHRLALLAGTLESYSPVKKLSGGYAFVEDGNHQALRSIHQIRKKDTVQIHLLDGTLTAAVTEIQAAEGVKNE